MYGKCRAAMWWGYGAPAGLCGEDAFGATVYGWDGVPKLMACPAHGGPKIEYKMDGNQVCATIAPHRARGIGDDGRLTPIRAGFINLQESPAGFGGTEEEALRDLIANIGRDEKGGA